MLIIYKTTNTVNGKIYIGQHSRGKAWYLGSGSYLERAVKKYGRDKFVREIIEVCPNREILNERERYWIAFYGSTNKTVGYNLTLGGEEGHSWECISAEQRKRRVARLRREARKWNKSEQGRQFRADLIQRMRNHPDRLPNLRAAVVGRKVTWGKKISRGLKKHYKKNGGHRHTKETRRKMSKTRTGKELLIVGPELANRIRCLYWDFGPKKMSRILEQEGTPLSPQMIIRTLKKLNIYQPNQKGLKHWATRHDLTKESYLQLP